LLTRFRIKPLMMVGCICLGTGLLIHSQANSVGTVYLSRFLVGASLGFVGVAPNVVLVSNWFRSSRGMAVGIVLTGTSIGGLVMPLVAAPLIVSYGWRIAMLTVSLTVWLVLLPAILFFVTEPARVAEPDKNSKADGLTLSEALTTTLFWVFGLAAASVFYPIFATTQQFIDLAVQHGGPGVAGFLHAWLFRPIGHGKPPLP